MRFKTLFFTATAVISLAAFVYAASPGTTDDPLVSKSYVEKLINEAFQNNSSGTNSVITNPAVNTSNSTSNYVPVNVKIGQKLIGEEGTEIILRSGRGFGYVSTESGIVDITQGTEVFNNEEIIKNHMLIIPRDDGRGIRIVEDSWFLVKGGYKIIG